VSYRRNRLFAVAGAAGLVLGWWAISLLAGSFFVPPPWLTLRDALLLLASPGSWLQVGITLLRVGAGFLAAFAAGTAAGMAAGRRAEVEALLAPGTLFIQGIPPLLWAIPIILVLGIGHLSPILVIALICYPLVVLTVTEGMKTVPRHLEEMLQLFAAGRWPRLREVVIPHLRPFFASSLRLGVTLGIKASVVGEYFGANDGIGFQIQAAFQTLQVRRLFAWGLVLIALILVTSRALAGLLGKGRGEAGGRRPAAGALAGGCIAGRRESAPCTERDASRVRSLLMSRRRPSSLILDRVTFAYPVRGAPGRPLLEGVSLYVGPGDIAVVYGESGAGKTTLLKIAASLLAPRSGEVGAPPRVGMVFQDDRLIPWRTVLWNVALPVRYQGFRPAEACCLARMLLREVGLEDCPSAAPEELSGGMKKRAALARCFARFPDLTLLDEPFSGLDREARRMLWERFFHLMAEFPGPAVVVTHYPEELEGYPGCSFYELAGRPAILRPVRGA
jgi:ABC-type nitrate/sulfonate/bicarbonate transport system ATPase subunit/ABC-type nitrate/sulfonate/bicarbonate transport system permease component